jgi:hypothetical protein
LATTEQGNLTAVKAKRSILLDRNIGVVDAMLGVSIVVSEILGPINDLHKRVQTTSQPIQHKLARAVDLCMHTILSQWTPSSAGEKPRFTSSYRKWREGMFKLAVAKPRLVTEVDGIAMKFAEYFVKILRARLAPYYAFYAASELVDPSAAAGERPALSTTWEAVRELCERNGLDFGEVQDDIERFRTAARIGSFVIPQCRKNLLRMFRNGTFNKFPHVCEFAALVFSLPFSNALVESLFSVMGFNKSGSRSSLKLNRLKGIAHLHDAADVLTDVKAGEEGFARTMGAFTASPQLDLQKALDHETNWGF